MFETFSGTLFDEGLLGVHSKVSQCPTSVRNEMAYEYISMDNIQLVGGLLGEKPKKQNHEGLRPNVDNIIPMWMWKGP